MGNKDKVLATNDFLERITKVPGFVAVLLDLLAKSKPELKAAKRALLEETAERTGALEPLVKVFEEIKRNAPEGFDLNIDELFRGKIHDAVDAEYDEYGRWIIDWGLLQVVATLDAFLEELVITIMYENPETLLTFTKDRDVSLHDIVRTQSVDDLLDKIRMDEVRSFGFKSLPVRFQMLEGRLGLPVTKILQWGQFTPEAQEELKAWDVSRIDELYERRHRIAHGRTVSEDFSLYDLRESVDVLSKVILSLSLAAVGKHQVTLDFSVPAKQFLEYWEQVAKDGLAPPPESWGVT